MMDFLFWFTIGNIFGSCVSTIMYNRMKAFGTLIIEHPEPETDVYRIEIDNFNILAKKKKVILRVKDENQTSHK